MQVKMPERDAAERARELRGGEPRLRLRPTRCARPSAASSAPSRPASRAARSASTSRASSATCWCATSSGALDMIHESNPFPSVCGRVCPQESQCEAQCVLIKAKMEPVGIGRLERFVGDNAKPRPVEPPAFERKLGKVAIVGSGPGRPRRRGRPAASTAPTSRCSRRCTWSAACCATASRRSACRATSSSARCSSCATLGVKFETNKVIGKTFTDRPADRRDGLRRGVRRGRRRRARVPRHPGRVRRAGLLGQRVPHPRQPDGRRPLPVPRHAGQRRPARRRDRRRQHRDGLPARRQAAGRADSALRLPPLRGRGAGAHRGAAPRQGGGHRVQLPARPGRRSCWTSEGDVRGLQGAEDDARRTRRARPAHAACRWTSSSSGRATR